MAQLLTRPDTKLLQILAPCEKWVDDRCGRWQPVLLIVTCIAHDFVRCCCRSGSVRFSTNSRHHEHTYYQCDRAQWLRILWGNLKVRCMKIEIVVVRRIVRRTSISSCPPCWPWTIRIYIYIRSLIGRYINGLLFTGQLSRVYSEFSVTDSFSLLLFEGSEFSSLQYSIRLIQCRILRWKLLLWIDYIMSLASSLLWAC